MERESLSPEIKKVMESKEWYWETLANKVIKALEKNNIPGVYARTTEETLEKTLSLIPEGSKIGHGGSVTLEETGIMDALRKGGYNFLDRRKPGLTDEDIEALRRESLLADVFLMSTNALTLDGKLVNIDGEGNRVAALSYGPSRVIIVAGINKIVPDLEAAIYRIKNYASPLHARRRDRPVPCGKTGMCADCRMEERMCNIVTIIEHQKKRDRIQVVICGEELGL